MDLQLITISPCFSTTACVDAVDTLHTTAVHIADHGE